MSKRYFQDNRLRGRVDKVKFHEAKHGQMIFLSLAIVQYCNNTEGKSEPVTQWFEIGVFGKLVNAAKNIRKGDIAEICVKMVQRKIQDEKGSTKSEIRLVAQEIVGVFLLEDCEPAEKQESQAA